MRKHLTDRRQRNAELAKRDADNRCVWCKRNLAEVGGGITIYRQVGPSAPARSAETPRRFCAWSCVEAEYESKRARVGR